MNSIVSQMHSIVALTTCARVIFLYQGVSSIGIAFMVGERSAGSVNGFDLLSGPNGLAAFLADTWPEPPKGEDVDLVRSLPTIQMGFVSGAWM